MTRLLEIIKASDGVVLLSPAVDTNRRGAGESERELSLDLDRRDIELIPLLVAPTDVPSTPGARAGVQQPGQLRSSVDGQVVGVGRDLPDDGERGRCCSRPVPRRLRSRI
jgi:hypothetical protein